MADKAFPLTLDAFNRLGPRQKAGVVLAIALAVAVLVGGWLWAKEPSYAVLFSNLEEQDAGQIVTTLQQQNIPYKLSETGNAILVPEDQVHDIRLRLASQGLPKGGLVGFELLENQKLGVSQFVEQINYQRGLEGELARSIQSIDVVRAARVHLAIPRQTGFLRGEDKPSASVLVSLRSGRTLDASQIAGIVHLVSSSVPELSPNQVSIIDQDGNLLTQQSDMLRNAGLDASQIKYVQAVEQGYVKRIDAILEPVVGRGNVHAQVSADIDFSQVEQVAETYKPNPAPDSAIRSQQTSETGSATPGAMGVPGALTNQPPVPATAPLTTPPVPGAGKAPGAATANAQPSNYSKNATINYEVDKTVKHTKGMPGVIRRLSVAVVVNNKQDQAKGKSAPLTAAEMKQVSDLTADAVGLDKQRGDTLNVANIAFAAAEKEAIPAAPFWENPTLIAAAKEIGKWLVFALIAYLVWTKALKPLFAMFAAAAERVKAEEEARTELAMETAEAGHPGTHRRRPYEAKIQQARDLARQEPKLVANVIKEWVGGGEPR
jgi:flagellar M-ring protein FliF